MKKIYVASSWRNAHQPAVVQMLRRADFDVYDFRDPAPGVQGFNWREIDPNWQEWTTRDYKAALEHPVARRGFAHDELALRACDACVLVLPSGRSAHLEAGFATGAGKPTVVYMPERQEPELMYLLANCIIEQLDEIPKLVQYLLRDRK